MSIGFINGAKYAVLEASGLSSAISGITNAADPIASATTTPDTNSIVVVRSNWSELNDVPAKVGTVVAGTSFQIPEYDTTDTTRFPVGEGVGTYETFANPTTINDVISLEPEGGEQNYYTYQPIDDPSSRERRIPTNKSAMGWTMTINYDPDRPWYEKLIELDRKKVKVVLRETLTDGSVILYYGYISFNKVPTKVVNETMKVTATFSLDTDPVRYPPAA